MGERVLESVWQMVTVATATVPCRRAVESWYLSGIALLV